jgi:hypothetical protein
MKLSVFTEHEEWNCAYLHKTWNDAYFLTDLGTSLLSSTENEAVRMCGIRRVKLSIFAEYREQRKKLWVFENTGNETKRIRREQVQRMKLCVFAEYGI